MAVTLLEQRQAFEDGNLRIKVGQAMCVRAQALLLTGSGATANQVILARQVLGGQHIDEFLRAAIAANAGAASLAAVLSATDAQIQTAVNNVFDTFANGM